MVTGDPGCRWEDRAEFANDVIIALVTHRRAPKRKGGPPCVSNPAAYDVQIGEQNI
jgi:2-oxoglutarate dehydrogenase complex dehydrogenase (E1) component-like enzyme